MTTILIKTAVSIAAGFFSGISAVYVFNKMPARWLCDYGEKPSREIEDPYIQRVKGFPWKWIYGAGFSCLLVRLSFIDIGFAAAALFACWALLIIGLADLKYMIIPDQFVVMLALSGIGFVKYHENVVEPLGGMAIGGGVMLMTAVLGGAAFGKEVMGFGDVKLFASLGLVLGIKGTLITLAGASIFSGIGAAASIAAGRSRKGDIKPLGPYICGWGICYLFIIWPFVEGKI